MSYSDDDDDDDDDDDVVEDNLVLENGIVMFMSSISEKIPD